MRGVTGHQAESTAQETVPFPHVPILQTRKQKEDGRCRKSRRRSVVKQEVEAHSPALPAGPTASGTLAGCLQGQGPERRQAGSKHKFGEEHWKKRYSVLKWDETISSCRGDVCEQFIPT